MRGLNRSIVISAIRERGTLSRADLVRFTSISPASVSAIVSDLMEEGLVREEGRVSSDVGRPGRLVRFAPVPSTERVARILADYVVEVTSRSAPGRIVGAGIGVPGVVNPTTGHVQLARLLGWEDAEFGELLSDCLRIPVSVDNDVAFSLAAEVDRGAATKARDAVLLTFAEGVGGAVLLDGKIYRGRGVAGRAGYMVTDASGADGVYHGFGMLEGKLFELVT
jgi:predicted NBD/HSP70 family sugar kinase